MSPTALPIVVAVGLGGAPRLVALSMGEEWSERSAGDLHGSGLRQGGAELQAPDEADASQCRRVELEQQPFGQGDPCYPSGLVLKADDRRPEPGLQPEEGNVVGMSTVATGSAARGTSFAPGAPTTVHTSA